MKNLKSSQNKKNTQVNNNKIFLHRNEIKVQKLSLVLLLSSWGKRKEDL